LETIKILKDEKMSNLVKYAKSEFARIPLPDDDNEIDIAIRKHIIRMVKAFDREGHSGSSATYAIDCLQRLLAFKPLTPLTGEDDEWMDVDDDTFQNIRYTAVFKKKDQKAYNINGKVFWEWYENEDTGEKYKSYFTCYKSRVPVEFPYVVPDQPIYEEWTEDDADQS
jgi:hypothetical protein